MKRIIITTIFLSISIFTFAQSNYYWSAGKKHYLKENPTVFIVKFSGTESFQDAQKELQKNQGIQYVTPLKNDLGIVIVGAGTVLTSEKLKAYSELENAMPAYKLGELPFYLTGEILLQPKANVPVEKILEVIYNKAKVKSITKYNTFVLETDNWEKLLEYSNRIYESGLVVYCHPNFIAPIEKTTDPLYSDQYYLNNTGQFGGTAGIDINAPEAWNMTLGSSTIRVAVIDDGAETHEELTGRVLAGFTPQTSANNPDTHGAPNANDPPVTTYPFDPDGPFGHGESCTGIIAASHNTLGIRGVAPNVQIVPVNIFNDWHINYIFWNGQMHQ